MLRAIAVGIAFLVTPPIVGGTDADQPYLFMVSIQENTGDHFCGGSLVKPDWVLTAAHCVQNNPPADMTARIGSNELGRGGEIAPITQVVVHSGFDGVTPGNDIALLRLAVPVRVTPVPIAKTVPPGTATRLLGWGQTCPQLGQCSPSAMLQQLDTRLLESANCLDIDGKLELCTESPHGAGACYGDSGGPQLVKDPTGWQLAGVTSRAGNDSSICGTGPAIYTSVIAYTDWIARQTT